jgi:hypothetical protein
MKLESKFLKFPNHIVGHGLCAMCRVQVKIRGTKDVLCMVNQQLFGLCSDCEPKFKNFLEQKMKEELGGKNERS